MTKPILVICSYRPKPGQEAALAAIMAEHVPMLHRLGLATNRPAIHAHGKDGVMIEIFEWASEAASRSAHNQPEVGRVWGRFAEVSDFVALASLEEAQRPFAHFTPRMKG